MSATVASMGPPHAIAAFDDVGVAGTSGNSAHAEDAAGEVTYTWTRADDRLDWQVGAASVLGIDGDIPPSTLREFRNLIVDEHVLRHIRETTGCVERVNVRSVPYRLLYRIAPLGPRTARSVWIEEVGRWWPGPDGRPARARASLRSGELVDKRAASQCCGDRDELSGQLSRIRLTDALQVVLERVCNQGHRAALLLIAVNNLQAINATFGFATGDEVLRAVGRRLGARLRGGDSIGRYASNKFAVVLNNCEPGEIPHAAARLRGIASAALIETRTSLQVASLSIGGVALSDDHTTTDMAYGHAMRALEEARHASDAGFRLFSRDGARELRRVEALRISSLVSQALRDHRMELHLQPIVRADDRSIAFHEGLLRIRVDGQPTVAAGAFMEVAEKLGFASAIDNCTLALAGDLLSRRRDLVLSLNVSALTCTEPKWLASLGALVESHADIGPRLIIEITETAAIKDLDETAFFVDAVRDLGCKVALDDFGSGYTSFSNLKRLKAHILKVDGAYVRNMLDSDPDRVIVGSMLELGRNFGMETVAEWVADERTADALTAMGADYLQGYHFGTPVPVAAGMTP